MTDHSIKYIYWELSNYLFLSLVIKNFRRRAGSLFLVLAFAESASAVSFVKSRTSKARLIFDFSRLFVEVWDLLHKVFVELVLSCCKIHGVLIASLRKRFSFRFGGKEEIHLLRRDAKELFPYLRNCCKCPN